MKRNMKLPFTITMTGGNKESFKILNSKQINEGIHEKIKNDDNILSLIKKMFVTNNSNKKSLNNNTNKIKYLKATSTEEYYKKINSKKSIK
jgi:hypothetical protein